MLKINSIDKINKLNKSDFLSIFGNVFEKTEWIAEKVFALKPFKNINDLFSKMILQYENSFIMQYFNDGLFYCC